MPHQVLLLEPLHPDALDFLVRKGRVICHEGWPALPEETVLARVDAVMTRGLGQIGRPLMDACPRLRIAARCGVGLDNVDVGEATRRGIRVVNAPGSNAAAVAEHTLALMLALQRQLLGAVMAVKNGNWAARNTYAGDDFQGKTLGIVGMGHIGSRVARIAAAMDMEVLYDAPRPKEVPYLRVRQEELLERADAVSLHLPLLEHTRQLIGSAALRRMKPGSLLINTARADLIDRTSLLEALDFGHLAGYGADVPMSPNPGVDDPLIAHPKTCITPHVSSLTATTFRKMCLTTASNVLALLEGDQPAPGCIFNAGELALHDG